MSVPDPRENAYYDLHEVLTKIIDGPGSRPDSSAIEALIGIGKIIAAARWALDYEMGRIKAGHWRSRSNLLLRNYDLAEEAREELLMWVGTSLTSEEEQGFLKQGRIPGRVDEERLLVATMMAAFAIGSKDERIAALARGLTALNQGETVPLLTPLRSARARGGHGHPDAITMLRLNAILGIEYQRAVGAFASASAARQVIAEFYGVTSEAMGKWPRLLRKSMGAERLGQEMDAAKFCGLVARQSKFHGWTSADKLAEGAEEVFGLEALQASGKRFQEQRRGSND